MPLVAAVILVEPVRAQRADSVGHTSTDSPTVPPEVVNADQRPGNDVEPATDRSENSPESIEEPEEDGAKLRPEVGLPRVILRLRSAEDKVSLAGMSVRIRRMRIENRPFEFDANVRDIVSDDNGIVALTLPDIQENVEGVVLEIDVAGRAPEQNYFEVQRTMEPSPLRVIGLWPALELSMRVFDSEGRPDANARVRVLADVGAAQLGMMWHTSAMSDADGFLKLRVPPKSSFGLCVTSEHGAPYRKVFPAGTTKIQNIYLPRGTIVAGQLLDRDGKPIPDCDVVMQGDDTQAVNTEFQVGRSYGMGQFNVEFTRRTNAQGRFHFPPISGPVRVHLGHDVRPELQCRLIPVSLDLPASGETWLPLMMSPTGTVSGTVRWPDGRPEPGVEVHLQVPPKRSRSYISLGSVITDAAGHYQLSIPFPLDDALISLRGVSGPLGENVSTRCVTNASGGRSGRSNLTRYVGEPLTIDWEVSIFEGKRPVTVQENPPPIEPLWQPLADLELEIEAIQKKGEDPRDVLIDRCLEFEARHRGTRLGLGALHFILRAAATSVNPIPDAGRERAIPIIVDYYVKHPDVDKLLEEFDAGFGTSTCETLLQKVADESPFDYVRAKALYELAVHQFSMLRKKKSYLAQPPSKPDEETAFIEMQSSQKTKDFLRQQYDQSRRLRELLVKINDHDLQQSALDLLDRVTSRYSGMVTPVRYWESAAGLQRHEGLKLVDHSDPLTWRDRTIAERAEILRFQQTRLQLGMTAPEVEGFDLRQQPIRLGQFRGKVVLLTTTLGNSEEKLYGQCAKLLKSVKDNRFTCVSIIPGGGSGGYSAAPIVQDGKITWPIIRDTGEDNIGHLWCQQSFPAIYLIDKQGVIRHFDEGSPAVTGLLKQIRKLIIE